MNNLQLELQFQNADFERLQNAWRNMLQRHTLLQRYVDSDGRLATTEHSDYTIKFYDLSLQANDKIKAVQDRLRADKALTSNQWPWFDLNAVRYDSGNIRLYCAFAADMLDPDQIHYLLREMLALYQNDTLPIHSLTLERPEAATKTNEHAFTLRYTHLFGKLEQSTLQSLRQQSIEHNIALPVVLLNAFKTELDRQDYEYPVYMSLANRFPFYPFMYDRACFATSVAGCEIKDIYNGKFIDNCNKIDSQLRQDSTKVSGTNLDELVQLPSHLDALALFSCSLEQDLPPGPLFAKVPDVIYCNFGLPTVDVDYAVWEQGGQLLYRWSYAKALPMIDSSADQSLLRNAMLEYPELKEIVSDNDAAKASNKGKAVAAAGLMMAGAGGASAAKGKQQKKQKALGTIGAAESTKQAGIANTKKKDSFDGLGTSMIVLANAPSTAWQDQKHPDDTQSDQEQNAQINDSSAAAISIGGGSALLAMAIGALKQADLNPSPSPAAPMAKELATMEPEEAEAAFDNYEKKVIQTHSAPSKSDLAQEDMCAQFTAMADDMGPDIGKVKGEMTTMGGTMDKVAGDMAKGDAKSAAAGLDKLSGEQAGLADKMNAEGIAASVDSTPLGQSATAVYMASSSISDDSSSADIAGLSDKVDALDSAVDGAGDYGSDQKDAAKGAAAGAAGATTESITNTPEYQNMQAKTDAVKDLGQEIAQYDCDSIIKQASQEKIDKLQDEANQLQAQIPQPTNPLDGKIAETQAKADAVKARAAELKNTSPDLAMQDPGLMSALDGLNASAGDMASNVQGQCPICSASNPDLPAVPKCGHNHGDVMKMTNPFHKPTLKLDASLNMLNQSSNPKLPAVVDKMKALKSKMQGMNPVPTSVPNVSNPYSVLKSAVDATKSRVVSLSKNLANCPDAPAETQSKLSAIESSLSGSQQKLQALAENNSSDNTNKKFTDLQDNMKKQTYGKAEGAQSAADKQRQQMMTAAQGGAMAKVTSSLACWQAVNMPAMSKGKPDETLVSGFKCKCPSAIGPPIPMMVKPGGVKINNKEVLLVNGVPLNQSMGMCIHLDKTKPIPCVSTILVTGGSKNASSMEFPVATKKSTKLMCPLGAKIQILDTGQDPSKPVMTP